MALSPSSSPSSPTVVPDPLPPGAVLAHVGIHKTGTTAIQSVLAQQREVLASHGVVYPGEQVNHHKAAMALTGTRWGAVEREGRPVPPIHWSNLVTAVRRTSDRVVISSEFFGDTRGANGERFRDELGPERLHVLIGVRPLPYVLASVWQQTLKLGRQHTFDEWLQKVYLGRRDGNPRTFWSRYSYGAMVQRWRDWLGPDRVNVVVLDDADHSWQPRVFEALLALPPGVIDGVAPTKQNRSLTAAEAEGLRRTNEMVHGLVDWPHYEPLVRNGAVVHMVENRTPSSGEARIAVPDWAVQHAVEEGRTAITEIRASGVRVFGRLELLGQVPTRMGAALSAEDATAVNDPPLIPMEAFAQALAGSLEAAVIRGVRPAGKADGALVQETTARELLRVVASRVGRRLAGRLRRQ
jgi:hypothetical protein